MKKFVFFLLTACLLVFNCSSSHAEESITYVDEDGIQHYLEKYNLIKDCEESFTIGESDKETWYVIK